MPNRPPFIFQSNCGVPFGVHLWGRDRHTANEEEPRSLVMVESNIGNGGGHRLKLIDLIVAIPLIIIISPPQQQLHCKMCVVVYRVWVCEDRLKEWDDNHPTKGVESPVS